MFRIKISHTSKAENKAGRKIPQSSLMDSSLLLYKKSVINYRLRRRIKPRLPRPSKAVLDGSGTGDAVTWKYCSLAPVQLPEAKVLEK